MIKVFWFIDDVATPWANGLTPRPGTIIDAAPTAPVRCTRNVVLLDDDDAGERPAAIDVAYFTDLPHADHYRQTVLGDDPRSPQGRDDIAVATEVVLRGEEWLTARWSDPGPWFKHMALARRAPGLSHEEFEERWKAHAGSAGSTPIPEALRGFAYVQNHMSTGAGSDDDTCYDAINEVWFGDLDLLRTRDRWLAENLPPQDADDLFGERQLLVVQETVVH